MPVKNIFTVSNRHFHGANESLDIRRAKDSWRATTWVIEHSALAGHAKLIAAIIASCYNTKKGYAFPSHSWLADESGLSKSTVNRAIQDIKLSGEWIVISGRKNWAGNKGGQTSNKYIPLAPKDKTDIMNKRGKWVSWLRIEIINNIKSGKEANDLPQTVSNQEFLSYYKKYVSDPKRRAIWLRGWSDDWD